MPVDGSPLRPRGHACLAYILYYDNCPGHLCCPARNLQHAQPDASVLQTSSPTHLFLGSHVAWYRSDCCKGNLIRVGNHHNIWTSSLTPPHTSLAESLLQKLEISDKRRDAELKSVVAAVKGAGLWHPGTRTLQVTGEKALQASVRQLVPPDELGGQAWMTAGMESWAAASRADVMVGLAA